MTTDRGIRHPPDRTPLAHGCQRVHAIYRISTKTTQTLVVAASAGDEEALNVLCQRLLPRLRAWVRGQLPAAARGLRDTDDLAITTLWSCVQRLSKLDLGEEGSFLRYLRTALKNELRKEITRSKRAEDIAEVPESRILPMRPGNPQPDQETEIREDMAEYEKALDLLTQTEQDLIVARLEFGMSFLQIAEWFGKPSEDAARMATNRAVHKLAEKMSHVRS